MLVSPENVALGRKSHQIVIGTVSSGPGATYINSGERHALRDGGYLDFQLGYLFPQLLNLLHSLASFLNHENINTSKRARNTFLSFQIGSHVSEQELLFQSSDLALRLHCLDPVVALQIVST